MELRNIISIDQVRAIRTTIKARCDAYRRLDEQRELLYYDPYTKYRRQHDLTSCVISGFAPNACNIPGFISHDLYYGMRNGMCQPELVSDRAVLHVYSNGASLKTATVKERAELYCTDLTQMPIYGAIVFEADRGLRYELVSLQIVLFNGSGEIVERFDLLQDA